MRRRKLKGKKLLVATVVIGASSLLGCGDDPVANLVAPPDDGGDQADGGEMGMDAGDPGMDAGDSTDAAMPDDADIMLFPDGPIANLVAPPPDSGTD